ncbi:hypothetical protein [Ruminiclostridium josui]|uniref:hypothetical protein n=1 Tax=Ruminiclostridium josui TaxID=1499 RepID=UPI000B287CE0|nr:hypothetical protein [Ruminiclostridium josui]
MQTNDTAPSRTPAKKKERPQYTGGLIVKCRKCGLIRGFFTHKPIDHYHCFECGKYTPLPPELRAVEVRCECGKFFKYQTNITDPAFDATCVECGAPVAVGYNEKLGRYLTIMDDCSGAGHDMRP